MSFDVEFSSAPLSAEKKLLDQLFKRLFDIVVATSVLILLSPLFLMLAAAVLLFEGRPVIFRHRRITVDAKSFDCLKFRSMVQNAEEKLQAHLLENPVAASEWQESQKLSRDPRINAFRRLSPLVEFRRATPTD